ncbi:MAG TPA: hypothetical protein ENI02_02985 [Candidatus Aminicenantes bacterium]|nr:hypothetical protein [Candidatus Aminicenantes bacterium]
MVDKKTQKIPDSIVNQTPPKIAVEPSKNLEYRQMKISTESALQEQVENMELQKYDLLEKLNMLKWQQENLTQVWKIQKSQIFKKLCRLDNNIAVVRKQINIMEAKMAEDVDKKDSKEDADKKDPEESDDASKDGD